MTTTAPYKFASLAAVKRYNDSQKYAKKAYAGDQKALDALARLIQAEQQRMATAKQPRDRADSQTIIQYAMAVYQTGLTKKQSAKLATANAQAAQTMPAPAVPSVVALPPVSTSYPAVDAWGVPVPSTPPQLPPTLPATYYPPTTQPYTGLPAPPTPPGYTVDPFTGQYVPTAPSAPPVVWNPALGAYVQQPQPQVWNPATQSYGPAPAASAYPSPTWGSAPQYGYGAPAMPGPTPAYDPWAAQAGAYTMPAPSMSAYGMPTMPSMSAPAFTPAPPVFDPWSYTMPADQGAGADPFGAFGESAYAMNTEADQDWLDAGYDPGELQGLGFIGDIVKGVSSLFKKKKKPKAAPAALAPAVDPAAAAAAKSAVERGGWKRPDYMPLLMLGTIALAGVIVGGRR